MDKEKVQSSTIKNKKKRIILLLFCIIFIIIVIFLLGMKTGNWLFGFVQENNVSQNKNENTIDNEIEQEGDDVLFVELEGKNEENNEPEEPNQNTVPNQVQPPKPVNAPYYIKVNCEANVVTIYKKSSNGKYTEPIKAMLCSIGTATPKSGVYPMTDKYTWRLLEGNVYGQYACRITGSILFHSVPYVEKDKSTLEWWEYDKLGTKASLGCVRLTVADAKWIYDNCIAGTKVEFYSAASPGPLGKPTVQKISTDTEVRHWDPTDPDYNNPWKTYVPSKEDVNSKEPIVNNVSTNTEEPKIDNNVNSNVVNESVIDNSLENINSSGNIIDENNNIIT